MSQDKYDTDSVNFGFKKVGAKNKQEMVNQVFSGVYKQYDLVNDIMSFGVHRFWKKQFCHEISNLNSRILDVASGTGDVVLQIKKDAALRGCNPYVVMCDINADMLQIAKQRSIDRNLFQNLHSVVANAEDLPFADNSFDYYTIAFGIRNVTNIEKALREAHRVLKPMGKFLCLEFSKVQPESFAQLYDFYCFRVLPHIGKVVTGNKEAYSYLAESIKLFPDQEHFRIILSEAGFKNVIYQNLTFGITAIHTGYKI